MAFQDSKGNKFTNRDQMRQSEARNKAKSPAQEAISHEEPQGAPDAANEQDGAALAQQHGPAVSVAVEHNDEAGQHTVHAVHPNMHEHQTQHASRGAAHRFAKDVAGANDADGDHDGDMQ